MFAEIMAALKAVQAIASLLKEANELRKEQMLKYEEKQIEEFKKGVQLELDKIKSAKSDDERRALIVSLSKQLSK